MDVPSQATPPQFQELVTANLPLVRHLAGNLILQQHVLDFDDLVSYGVIGLIQAAKRFDPTSGTSFASYASTRIRGAIIDGIRQMDPIPRHVRVQSKKADEAAERLAQRLARTPEDAEIAAELEIPLDELRRTRVVFQRLAYSFEAPHQAPDAENLPAEETIIDPDEEDFTQGIEKVQLLKRLSEAVTRLPERELLVVSLRYTEGLSLKEVAAVLGVSESRACQLHARAISRLRGDQRLAEAA